MNRFLIIILIILFFVELTTATPKTISNLEEEISFEDIEQELNQNIQEEQKKKIEREELTTLEEKKKESVAAEVEVSNQAESLLYTKKAKIIILNKITAKSEHVEFKVGQIKFFGNLSVELRKCGKTSDPVNSSSLMLLTIIDHKLEDDASTIFDGWMDSANPSISTLEHPVYEVIPTECIAG